MSLETTLEKALMDTVMGMGTVFVILILICVVISMFKFMPKPKTAKAAPPGPDPGTADALPENGEDEDELIAVILAAIRMAKEKEDAGAVPMEGTEKPREYIVRSIKRRR